MQLQIAAAIWRIKTRNDFAFCQITLVLVVFRLQCIYNLSVGLCCGKQKSAALLADVAAARPRREAYPDHRQQVNSHVPLSGNYEDVFPSVGLQSGRTAADSSGWLLGECSGSS